MDELLQSKLVNFFNVHTFTGKGPLSVALHVTRYAIECGLPIDAQNLKTDKKGQVKGLSKSRVQFILSQYGISSILAAEAGRTSRGSLDNMELYVQFLNELNINDITLLHAIEAWWVQKVKDFFAAKPFRFEYDQSKSLTASLISLLQQAEERQAKRHGVTYLGTMLQHLVGAKLSLSLERYKITITHHGASVADEQSAREGDFLIDKTAIHVTTCPGLSLIQKCKINLSRGYHPIIVTLNDKVQTAQVYAEGEGIAQRIDILPAEKFLAANLHEMSEFSTEKRAITIQQLIDRYNAIVEECETDPSLKISFG